MKIKELKDLRTKEPETLKKTLSEKRKEVLSKNTKNLRREIAQILTIIKEKEIISKIK